MRKRAQTTRWTVTVPAGEYWLGDPCYTIPDEAWIPWLEDADYQEIPGCLVARVGNGPHAMAFDTAYGDGTYYAEPQSDHLAEQNLPVDAGLIGLVPVSVGTPDQGLCVRVHYPHDTTVSCLDGVMDFGDYLIDTSEDWEN